MKDLELKPNSPTDSLVKTELVLDDVTLKKETKEDKIAAMISKANEAAERQMEKKRKAEELHELEQAAMRNVYKQTQERKKIEKIKAELARETEGREDDMRMEEIRTRENSLEAINACRERRKSILEKRGLLKMPKEEFEEYFASKDFKIRADLKQGNTGDCYAVAAIHALSNSPHYETIVRSSVKRLENGTWVVRIPLLSENQKEVYIGQSDIKPQENPDYSSLAEYLNPKVFSLVKSFAGKFGINVDKRKILEPVKGNEGLQVLEAAFIKHKFGTRYDKIDRLAAEGGWADDVLITYGGDNFIGDRVKVNQGQGLRSLPKKKLELVDKFLQTFDPEIHIATVSSKVTKEMAYKGINFDKKFVSTHAYSILEVNQKEKTMKLANPWDTSKSFELTFDQFKDNFAGISAIRINNAKLLKNMENILQKAA